MINSPWIKSDIPTFSDEMEIENGCGSSMQDTEGAMANEETRKMEETGQGGVRTRAQKRKLSFKENYEVQVSFFVLKLGLLPLSLVTEISVVLNCWMMSVFVFVVGLYFLWVSVSNIIIKLGFQNCNSVSYHLVYVLQNHCDISDITVFYF